MDVDFVDVNGAAVLGGVDYSMCRKLRNCVDVVRKNWKECESVSAVIWSY